MSEVHFVVTNRHGVPLMFCAEEIKARGKAEWFGGSYHRVVGPMPIDVGAASAEFMSKVQSERLELRTYAETLPDEDKDLIHQLLDDSVDELGEMDEGAEPTRSERSEKVSGRFVKVSA